MDEDDDEDAMGLVIDGRGLGVVQLNYHNLQWFGSFRILCFYFIKVSFVIRRILIIF